LSGGQWWMSNVACRADVRQAVPEGLRQAAADEVYAGGQPVLEVMEPRSGVILTLERAPTRDETAWGCAWLDLAERGVDIAGVVADGAEGLRAEARAARLPEPRLDHWHTLPTSSGGCAAFLTPTTSPASTSSSRASTSKRITH